MHFIKEGSTVTWPHSYNPTWIAILSSVVNPVPWTTINPPPVDELEWVTPKISDFQEWKIRLNIDSLLNALIQVARVVNILFRVHCLKQMIVTQWKFSRAVTRSRLPFIFLSAYLRLATYIVKIRSEYLALLWLYYLTNLSSVLKL